MGLASLLEMELVMESVKRASTAPGEMSVKVCLVPPMVTALIYLQEVSARKMEAKVRKAVNHLQPATLNVGRSSSAPGKTLAKNQKLVHQTLTVSLCPHPLYVRRLWEGGRCATQ